MLKPGQQLNIQPATYQKVAAITAINTANNSATNYTVKKGDTLWLISRRFGTTINQLIQWNNLTDSQLLRPGQTLILFIDEA